MKSLEEVTAQILETLQQVSKFRYTAIKTRMKDESTGRLKEARAIYLLATEKEILSFYVIPGAWGAHINDNAGTKLFGTKEDDVVLTISKAVLCYSMNVLCDLELYLAR